MKKVKLLLKGAFLFFLLKGIAWLIVSYFVYLGVTI